jgi:hypothetical protein
MMVQFFNADIPTSVKSSREKIEYVKSGRHFVRLESSDDCGIETIIWGFLAAVIGLASTVVFFCL